jgi:hypothetical protein
MREELIMLTAAELDVENCQPTDFPEPRTPAARFEGGNPTVARRNARWPGREASCGRHPFPSRRCP